MVAASAWSQDAIRYTLRFAPATNHVDVEAIYPTGDQPWIDLKMAVWTPYVIREFARHIETLAAETPSGDSLRAVKTRKNRWRVETCSRPFVTVRYRLWAKSPHVQDNYVDAEFALLNGHATYVTLADSAWRPHEVTLVLPDGWKQSMTSMKSLGAHHYRAADYEELLDSPIIAGNPATHEFRVDGKLHRLVNVGEKGSWDGPRSAADLAKIVEAQRKIWGSLPYESYTFFNILNGRGGGMEHSASTVMMAAHDATKKRESYLRWLGLASHEFFHTWNVKRLRPREITPGEYEEEQYTTSLGIAEGFTSYYGAVALRRSGVATEDEFRAIMQREIDSLESREGRKVQSLAASSFDTWIKFYRPNDNSPRTTVSYYNKGAVVGLLLDARIRAATGGKRSLDDVMRRALERYPVARGYTLAEFRDVASEVAGVDLRAWFEHAFETTKDLDYSEAERVFGWTIRR
jgi:predicted metalloprotease with PDZ domain